MGYRVIIVGLERREDKLRGKGYIGIGFIIRRLKFMRYKETLKAISHNNSSFNMLLLSRLNTPKRSKLDWLPKKLSKLLP
jgi:hypothetical protein